MQIALINGSPKSAESTSGRILSVLDAALRKDGAIEKVALRAPAVDAQTQAILEESAVWVLAFPLYVDGVPSHLISCMQQIEKMQMRDKTVYAVINCGFYEGEQSVNALNIMENWADRCGYTFGGALGIGGGPALAAMAPEKWAKGPMHPVYQALESLAEDVRKERQSGLHFTTVSIPRQLYRMAGQMGFKAQAKQYGQKNLGLRPEG